LPWSHFERARTRVGSREVKVTEGTKTPIQVGDPQTKTGLPPRSHKLYKSKYDDVIDQAKALQTFDDYVSVPSNGDGKRLLAAIRTAIKRRAKEENLGARENEGSVLVFRKTN
jgi:membrane protease subunit (stomatin/prohibitin family)